MIPYINPPSPPGEEIPASMDRKKYEIVLSVTRLVGLLAILMGIFTGIYSFILDSKLANLELRLSNQFISKNDAMSKSEYEFRHMEVVKTNDAQSAQINALEFRIRELEKEMLIMQQEKKG